MSVILLGGRDGILNFQQHNWWAERGMVHWENTRTGNYGSLSVRQTLERLRALNEMIGRSTGDGVVEHADAMKAHQDYVDGMVAVCKKAQAQGMPDDPQAARHLADSRRRSVVVPGAGARF